MFLRSQSFGGDLTHCFVAHYNYQLPLGKGQRFGSHWNKGVNAVLGGWPWSGMVTAHSGLPLSINPAANNTVGAASYGGGQPGAVEPID